MTEARSADQPEYSRLKRGVFEVLGMLATASGLGNALGGALVAPIYPVAGIAYLGIGGALLYGGYKAFQHAKETELGIEHDNSREARVRRWGSYIGGAALLSTGLALAGAEVTGVSLAVRAGVLVAGLATAAWGLYTTRRSFANEPVAREVSQPVHRQYSPSPA